MAIEGPRLIELLMRELDLDETLMLRYLTDFIEDEGLLTQAAEFIRESDDRDLTRLALLSDEDDPDDSDLDDSDLDLIV